MDAVMILRLPHAEPFRHGTVVLRKMGCGRTLLCIFLPPLAVLDKGCGPVLLTTLLWICGWVPGVIAAIIFCTREA